MAGSIDLGNHPFADGAGSAQFNVDFNDSLQVISLRCVNTHPTLNAFCAIQGSNVDGSLNPNAKYGQSFPPGTTVIGCDLTPANKVINLTANAAKPGKYTGIGSVDLNVPG